MDKTRWSYGEIDLVAPVAARYASADLFLYEAVDKAQREVLPESRWKKLTTNTQIITNVRLSEAIKNAKPLGEFHSGRRPKQQDRPQYDNGWVKWSNAEVEKVTVAASDEVREGVDMLDAVLNAQEKALPPGRRRNIRFLSNITKHLQQQIRALAALPPRKPPMGWVAEPLPEQTPEPVQDLPVEASATPATGIAAAALAPSELKALNDRMSSMEFMLMHITDLLETQAQNTPVQQTINNVQRAKKPKVMLSGLLPEQFQMALRTWGEFFDLRHIKHEQAKHVSLDALKNADFVIYNRAHNSHAVQDRIKAVVPKDRFILVNDPVTGPHQALASIFSDRLVRPPVHH